MKYLKTNYEHYRVDVGGKTIPYQSYGSACVAAKRLSAGTTAKVVGVAPDEVTSLQTYKNGRPVRAKK
jgi:hypothetical protein